MNCKTNSTMLCFGVFFGVVLLSSSLLAQHTQFSAGFNLPAEEGSYQTPPLVAPLFLEDNPPGSGTAHSGTTVGLWTTLDTGVFQVSGGEIAVGDLSGSSAVISRSISYGSPLDTQWFVTKLTQVEDNHNDYEAAAGFSDSTSGNTIVRFGILHDHAVNADGDEFFLELYDTSAGSLQRVTTHTPTTGTVAANTPYWLVGSVSFDDSGNEVARLWANAMKPTDAPILTISKETGFSQLGDTVFFAAETDEPNTLKTFDNLLVANRFTEVNGAREDIDTGGASTTQSGYDSWDLSSWSGGPIKKSIDVANDWGWASYGTTKVDVTVESIDATDGTGTTSGTAPAGQDWVGESLIGDGITVTANDDTGGIQVKLENLQLGMAFLETYHFGSTTDLDIYVQDGDHAVLTKVGFVDFDDPDLTLTTGGGDDVIRGPHGFVELQPDGTNPVIVEYRPVTGGSGVVALNGFALIPEPSSGLLILLGLAGMLGIRRRQRN